MQCRYRPDENAFKAETEIDVANSQTYLTPDLHFFVLNKRSKISLLFLTILHPVFTKLLFNYFHFAVYFQPLNKRKRMVMTFRLTAIALLVFFASTFGPSQVGNVVRVIAVEKEVSLRFTTETVI